MHKIINACYKNSLTMNITNNLQLHAFLNFFFATFTSNLSILMFAVANFCTKNRSIRIKYYPHQILVYIYSDDEMICITSLLARTLLDLCTATLPLLN